MIMRPQTESTTLSQDAQMVNLKTPEPIRLARQHFHFCVKSYNASNTTLAAASSQIFTDCGGQLFASDVQLNYADSEVIRILVKTSPFTRVDWQCATGRS